MRLIQVSLTLALTAVSAAVLSALFNRRDRNHRQQTPKPSKSPATPKTPPEDPFLDQALADGLSLQSLEKAYILRVMEQTQGNRTQAAEILGIGRRTLYRKLNDFGISSEEEEK